ncbi:MAG: hypothetical protein ACR2RA_00370 [Geminicoccaceae bacterium]
MTPELAILGRPLFGGMALCLGALAATAPALAGEDEFIYVDRMPAVRGEHKRAITVDDEHSGQTIVQDLYAEDFDHAVIETYVLTVACGDGAAVTTPRTYIVALKYPPKKPSTFAIATLHDIYKEVYVEDRRGRIRLYENVPGQSMLTLSDRFKPACQPV